MAKDKKPNPLVQMGLFMDGDGIPLAFNISSGNTNEQTTLQPLEKQILKDFQLSKFIVCTDAGLASTANRKFNNRGDRAFITTQSIKKLKKFLKEWALECKGWRLPGKSDLYDIKAIDEELFREQTFYKERWINEDNLEQRLIVTYSIKYKDYQRSIRANQIKRAQKIIDANPQKVTKSNQNDYKRFIAKMSVTQYGEVAEETIYRLDEKLIDTEAVYDGFYGVCTNLEDDAFEIIKINRRRWEIEESFRIMKSEFEARPVYLRRDDRIIAHFSTCYLALFIYRYLEKILEERYTVNQIINCLKDYNFLEILGDGYIPIYTNTDIVEALHNKFDFRTDYEIVSDKKMRKIIKNTKL
jgi:transposase